MMADSRPALVQRSINILRSLQPPSNLPPTSRPRNATSPTLLKIDKFDQPTTFLTVFSVFQSDPIFKSHRLKKKCSAQKIGKNVGVPLAFFQIFSRFFLLNFQPLRVGID